MVLEVRMMFTLEGGNDSSAVQKGKVCHMPSCGLVVAASTSRCLEGDSNIWWSHIFFFEWLIYSEVFFCCFVIFIFIICMFKTHANISIFKSYADIFHCPFEIIHNWYKKTVISWFIRWNGWIFLKHNFLKWSFS